MKIIHVSAWAKAFTQFRMPMIDMLQSLVEKQVIYCPDQDDHYRHLAARGFELINGPVSKRLTLSVVAEIFLLACFLKKNRFDALIAHQPLGALVGITAGRLAGVPARIYSTGGLKYVPDARGLPNMLVRLGEVQIINWASAVLLVNREDEHALRRLPVNPESVHYVGPRGGCGIDTTVFSPAKREKYYTTSRSELGMRAEHVVIGFVGRCVWEKGLRELAEAAALLLTEPAMQNLRFCILGNGGDLEEFQRLVVSLGVDPYFIFPGYLPDIHRFVAAFDLFVLPSYREGLPISLLEAQAMGIPSVATNVRGSRELVEDGKTGLLIECRSAVALANALRRLIDEPYTARRLALSAVENIRANYSESALLPRTISVIQSTIERSMGRTW